MDDLVLDMTTFQGHSTSRRVDSERNQGPRSPVSGVGGIHDPRDYDTSLHCLFSLPDHQRHWYSYGKGYCRYVESCFEPLRGEEYNLVWSVLGIPKPRSVADCWPVFDSVCRAIQTLTEDKSIADIWTAVVTLSAAGPRTPGTSESMHPAQSVSRRSTQDEDPCCIAVFAVLCWATMTLRPKISWSDFKGSPSLLVHQDALNVSSHCSQKMGQAKRPVWTIFRDYQRGMSKSRWKHPVGVITAERSAALEVSCLNYESLNTTAKITLEWVSDLARHLDFDAVNRKLRVFRFPSFCLLSILAAQSPDLGESMVGNKPPVTEGILHNLLADTGSTESGKSATSNATRESFGHAQVFQEVLMSYRLLFGQKRKSGLLARDQLKLLKEESKGVVLEGHADEYDHLLDLLCTHKFDSKIRELPGELWPVSCRSFDGYLQEQSSYSAQDDFPFYGERLAKIQDFNNRQQPSKLLDLWRDRRNPLQWYTFWAVIIVGGNYRIANAHCRLSLELTVYLDVITLEPDFRTMIETTLRYLSRDKLYDTEKPYSVEFEVEEGDGVQKTNYRISTEPMTIHEITSSDDFTLHNNGFCVMNESTNLDAAEALRNPRNVEDAYLRELEVTLTRQFPEYERIESLEFVVRKRDERFPSNQKAIITHEQPACLAHSDYSAEGAIMQLRSTFPGQEEYFQDRDFDMINVWRPLVGPNDDWPLAVCDYTTIDPQNDIIAADRVHKDRIGENQLLFHNPRHRWYYIKGQQPRNLLVFRNTDASGQRAKSFHAAFFNPGSSCPPRQSCEARFVAFR